MKPASLSSALPPAATPRSPEPVRSAGETSPPGLATRARPRRILAIGGGKGGIGKSLVSSNLGIALAQAGHRVLLVDADLGGANLHTCLGVGQPGVGLGDFVHAPRMRLEDVAVETGVPGLRLVAGAQDMLDAANLKYAQKQRLLRGIQQVQGVDYIVLDLGAGSSFNTLDFFVAADHGLLVLLPEPTSVENAYRFVKAAFFRRLQHVESQYGIEDLVETALTTRAGVVRTPFDFIAEVKAEDPQLGARLEKELHSFRVRLVVNQVRTAGDRGVGRAVVSAWKKFFGLEMDELGAIPYDDEAWRAVRKRRPVLLEHPDSHAAQGLRSIAERLLALDAPSR
ncbi:P-loop NTPase [Aggregicoccus sp. 17bor-14]|uniref:P-loop NTPase n=1 Tax=Myxococcaceae TaxID=31 RepID=UPI003519D99E